MLASRLGSFEDLKVADLFAGSGALGLEALSRGASAVTFVELDARAVSAIRRNTQKLGAEGRVRIIPTSALSLPQSDQFDLIFADPPYAPGAGSAVVQSVCNSGWLARGGWMSVETNRNEAVEPAGFELESSREVGRTLITLLRRP